MAAGAFPVRAWRGRSEPTPSTASPACSVISVRFSARSAALPPVYPPITLPSGTPRTLATVRPPNISESSTFLRSNRVMAPLTA